MLGILTDWVIDVVETLGYVGVALLVAVENIFPPIPSEVVLGLAGFVASRGDATLWGMLIASTVGSLLGAWALYLIAAAVGVDRLRRVILRYERWLRVREIDLNRAEAWFDRHAGLAVLICRCVPLVRSLISLPAGFRGMPPGRFTLYTTIGSLAWNTIFIVAGYQLGERWETVEKYANYFQYMVMVAIGLAVLYFIWRRWLRSEAPTGTDPSR